MSCTYTDDQIINQWLECQPSTLTRSCYARDVKRLRTHTNKPLNQMRLGDLLSFAQSLSEAGLAPISRARTLAAVKSLFRFCQRMAYIESNPAIALPLPRYESRLAERMIGEGDVERLLSVETSLRDRALVAVLYLGGLRVSEACNLRWRNLQVRGDAGQVTVFGKNGRTRAIPIPQEAWSMLVQLRGDTGADDLVFASRSGRRLDRGRVGVILRRAAQRAELTDHLSPHWLRHAHASHALDHGAPIHLVQATLGHSSVATTSRYLHAQPGDSSSRFLVAPASRIALPFSGTRAMNVVTANRLRNKENTMIANDSEASTAVETAAPEPKRKTVKKPKRGKRQPSAKKASTKSKADATNKKAEVIALMKRSKGATMAEIMKATGWQAHTVRGFVSILGKKGMKTESSKSVDGIRTYKIAI
jgi:integrase/recombinase XerD